MPFLTEFETVSLPRSAHVELRKLRHPDVIIWEVETPWPNHAPLVEWQHRRSDCRRHSPGGSQFVSNIARVISFGCGGGSPWITERYRQLLVCAWP
jgi:hypothetical protein